MQVLKSKDRNAFISPVVCCPEDIKYTYFNLSKAGKGLRQERDGHDLASPYLISTNSSVKEEETYRFFTLGRPTI